MSNRTANAFLILVFAQTAHSIEEYVFRLYEVFPPAAALSTVFSSNPRVGFAIGNTLLVAFGFWCYFARVRRRHPSAEAWMWPWVIIEAANGIMHPSMALARGGYFPGAITAPLLLIISIYLGTRLARGSGETPSETTRQTG